MKPCLLPFFLLIAIGCGQSTSQLQTVDIPQTPVKSQGGVGFCWAYATIGQIESTRLASDGSEFDLSEEALGFYRIAEELSYLGSHFSAAELATSELVREAGFEGITGSDFLFHDQQKAYGRFPGGFQLAHKYGVVPESAWSVKFAMTDDGRAEGSIAINNIIERFVEFKAANPDNTCCDVETLVSNIMLAPADELGFHTPPPSRLTVDGVDQTSTAFLKANFNIRNPQDYDVVTTLVPSDYDRFVQRTKEALVRGEVVPLEFSIDDKFMDFANNTFTGEFNQDSGLDPDDPASHEFSLDGGHVVLITDFVNVGGKPGLVSEKEKAAALAADPSLLDYFVVKNSWGTGGNTPNGIAPGFYLIKKKYLEIHIAAHKPDRISTLFVAVPKAKKVGKKVVK